MSQPINIQDELKQAHAQQMTRRALLGRTTQGLGLVALASLPSQPTLSAYWVGVMPNLAWL